MRSGLVDRAQGGLVGLYALSMMQRGPIFGSEVTHRISELTKGNWRLGAGALYPTLNGLVKRGWARVDRVDGRRRYSITKAGTKHIVAFRSSINAKSKKYLSAWRLVLDLVEPGQLPDLAIRTLKESLDVLGSMLKVGSYGLTAKQIEQLSYAIFEELDKFERGVGKRKIKEVAN